jgi:hypothetical protein
LFVWNISESDNVGSIVKLLKKWYIKKCRCGGRENLEIPKNESGREGGESVCH